jgi:hypothetical protein
LKEISERIRRHIGNTIGHSLYEVKDNNIKTSLLSQP